LGRDRTFWLVVIGLFVAYLILEWRTALSFVVTLIVLIVAVTVHECAHAWVANRLGDPTARYLGRISLNPLVHLDPLGTAMMVLTALTGFGIGWGKPVPVNSRQLRYGPRVGMGLVSLAGPASNLILAMVLGLLARAVFAWGHMTWTLALLFNAFILTNIALAFFNLLPVPPLDGYHVLLGLLGLSRSEWSWRLSRWLSGLERYGFTILAAVVIFSQLFGLNIIGRLIGPPVSFFYRLALGQWG